MSSMPAGRLSFAASLSTNSEGAGEHVAGGAGAVVLHAAGEVAAVEHGTYATCDRG